MTCSECLRMLWCSYQNKDLFIVGIIDHCLFLWMHFCVLCSTQILRTISSAKYQCGYMHVYHSNSDIAIWVPLLFLSTFYSTLFTWYFILFRLFVPWSLTGVTSLSVQSKESGSGSCTVLRIYLKKYTSYHITDCILFGVRSPRLYCQMKGDNSGVYGWLMVYCKSGRTLCHIRKRSLCRL